MYWGMGGRRMDKLAMDCMMGECISGTPTRAWVVRWG